MSSSIITQFIELLLDKLKAKNGFVYAIIMAIFALIYFGLQYVISHPELGIVIPTALQNTVNIILVILTGLVGSHTVAKTSQLYKLSRYGVIYKAKKKSWFGRILSSIISFFGSAAKHVLMGAEKTFKDLPDSIKNSLIHGSGILDVLNRMIGSTPDSIRAAILETFPDLDEAAMEQALFSLAKGLNIVADFNSLDDVIKKIQDYISSKASGGPWEDVMHSLSLLLAFFLAPKGTKFGLLANLVEYVYQTFIKKD